MTIRQTAKQAIQAILPASAWQRLRKIYRRSSFPTAPVVMDCLLTMRRQGFEPETILDVGAAFGNWTLDCRVVFPTAKYVLLEPNPTYQKDLESLVSDNISYLQVAAGPVRAELPLLVPEAPEGSSFLPAVGEDNSFFRDSIPVPVMPLDEIDLEGTPDLVKLDVQGYELEVLKGADRVLSQADVLILECSLHPFQESIPLVHEVISFLATKNYRLYDLGDETRWRSGTLAQVDLIFVSESSPLLDPAHWH